MIVCVVANGKLTTYLLFLLVRFEFWQLLLQEVFKEDVSHVIFRYFAQSWNILLMLINHKSHLNLTPRTADVDSKASQCYVSVRASAVARARTNDSTIPELYTAGNQLQSQASLL